MRKAFIDTLIQQAHQNDKIWLLVADVGYNLVEPFRDEFPDRFINVGVAEQNMIGVATGLALSGKTVFCYSLANFPILRCLEQIRNDVCYHNADVKIVSSGGGLMYGSLGASHHATEDLAIMRALPNMTVIAPCDPIEAGLATKAIAESGKPCFLRLSRTGDPIIHKVTPHFQVGKAIELREGWDVTLMATGSIMTEVLKAADLLASEGVTAGVLSFHTVKPIDHIAICYSALNTKAIVTVEEHNVDGGFGSAIVEELADCGMRINVRRVGIGNHFCSDVGSQQYLRGLNGLTAEHIAEVAREVLSYVAKSRVS